MAPSPSKNTKMPLRLMVSQPKSVYHKMDQTTFFLFNQKLFSSLYVSRKSGSCRQKNCSDLAIPTMIKRSS